MEFQKHHFGIPLSARPVSPGDGSLLKDCSCKLQVLARFEQVREIEVQGRPPVRVLALLALESEDQPEVTSKLTAG